MLVQITEDSFSQSQSNMSFYHERLESKMRNLIFVKYDITQTELLFDQSYTTWYTKGNMVIIELHKPRATHMKYIGGNEEFSKSKTTKLFHFTRDSRLIFQS